MRKRPTGRRRDAEEDDLRPEYDFTGATRGVTVARYRQGKNVFVIDSESAPPRISRRALVLAFAIPAAIALGWSLLLRPELPTLITPVLGPWAGVAFGHHECTMANAAPEVSTAVVALGIVVAAAWVFLRGSVARILVPALAAMWALGWCTLALFSVVNTCF